MRIQQIQQVYVCARYFNQKSKSTRVQDISTNDDDDVQIILQMYKLMIDVQIDVMCKIDVQKLTK